MRLLQPAPAWHQQAACVGTLASLFHNRGDEELIDRREREHAAVEVCRTCPVQRACLDDALQVPPLHQPDEIQGGMTAVQRKRELVHRLGGGEPRYDLRPGPRPKRLVDSASAAAALRAMLARGHTIDAIAVGIGRSPRCLQRLAKPAPQPQVEYATAKALRELHAALAARAAA